MGLTKEAKLRMFQQMDLIRKFENQAAESFSVGAVQGFVHLSNGEEAVAVGVSSNLRSDDIITSTHRGHGHVLAKGAKTDKMLAELCGRETGYNKGRGGSMHIASSNLGILGANGIVGAGQTLAAGAALASKIKKDDKVTVCYFGDAASNIGTFHESLNFASAYKLPVVYVVSNNGYGISTSIKKTSAVTDIASRAVGYGIPGVIVDGNDVEAVHEAAQVAIERARKGEGPTLLEFKTYRHNGHFQGDPAAYRPDGELEEWLKKDPVVLYRKVLLEEGISEEEIVAIENANTKEIKEGIEYALNSSFPDETSIGSDLYSDIIEEVR